MKFLSASSASASVSTSTESYSIFDVDTRWSTTLRAYCNGRLERKTFGFTPPRYRKKTFIILSLRHRSCKVGSTKFLSVLCQKMWKSEERAFVLYSSKATSLLTSISKKLGDIEFSTVHSGCRVVLTFHPFDFENAREKIRNVLFSRAGDYKILDDKPCVSFLVDPIPSPNYGGPLSRWPPADLIVDQRAYVKPTPLADSYQDGFFVKGLSNDDRRAALRDELFEEPKLAYPPKNFKDSGYTILEYERPSLLLPEQSYAALTSNGKPLHICHTGYPADNFKGDLEEMFDSPTTGNEDQLKEMKEILPDLFGQLERVGDPYIIEESEGRRKRDEVEIQGCHVDSPFQEGDMEGGAINIFIHYDDQSTHTPVLLGNEKINDNDVYYNANAPLVQCLSSANSRFSVTILNVAAVHCFPGHTHRVRLGLSLHKKGMLNTDAMKELASSMGITNVEYEPTPVQRAIDAGNDYLERLLEEKEPNPGIEILFSGKNVRYMDQTYKVQEYDEKKKPEGDKFDIIMPVRVNDGVSVQPTSAYFSNNIWYIAVAVLTSLGVWGVRSRLFRELAPSLEPESPEAAASASPERDCVDSVMDFNFFDPVSSRTRSRTRHAL